MRRLRSVIRVRELPPAYSRLNAHRPSIRELIRETPSADEPLILEYLARGITFEIFNDRGLTFDVIEYGRRLDAPDRPKGIMVASGLVLTDGVWAWDGVLPYYVARYHLQLPEEFLAFAAGKGWRIDPVGVDVAEMTWDACDPEPETANNSR